MGEDWSDNKADLYTSIVSTSAVLGIAIGALCAGFLIEKGRRRLIVFGNVVALIGSAMCMVLNYWSICAGRLLLGLASGLIMAAAPRMLEETVPPYLMGSFGVSTNLALNSAILIDSLFAIMMPSSDETEALRTTGDWRIILAIPFPFTLFSLLWLSCKHTTDSLAFNV